jgi:hypothetical protein
MKPTLVLALISGLSIAIPALAQESIPDIIALEKRILDQRRQITSGHLKLDIDILNNELGNNESIKHMVEVWFDKDKIRRDQSRPNTRTVTVFSDKEVIVWPHDSYPGRSDIPDANGASTTQHGTALITGLWDKRYLDRHAIGHPRLVGMTLTPEYNLGSAELQSVVGRADRAKPTIRVDRLDDKKVWVISFESRNGMAYRYWTCPELEDAVVKMESRSLGKAKLLFTLETQYAFLPSSDLWYPKSYVYREQVDGKLRFEERVAIDFVELNLAIPPEVFEFEHLGLPKGTDVVRELQKSGKSVQLVWNGTELISAAAAKSEKSSSGAANRLFVVLAIALGSLSALFVTIYFARKRNQR